MFCARVLSAGRMLSAGRALTRGVAVTCGVAVTRSVARCGRALAHTEAQLREQLLASREHDKPGAPPTLFQVLPGLLEDPSSMGEETAWRVGHGEMSQLRFPADHEASLDAVESMFGVAFDDRTLLTQALVHASYGAEQGLGTHTSRRLSNARLETLGDGVIDVAVNSYLFMFAPYAPPGVLTKYRHFMRSNDTLASLCSEMGLDEHMLVGKKHSRDHSRLSTIEAAKYARTRAAMQADVMEAVVAAVYLDQGMGTAWEVVSKRVLPGMARRLLQAGDVDPVTGLVQMCRKNGLGVEEPAFSYKWDPDQQLMTVRVHLAGKYTAKGTGATRREGKRNACQAALDRVRAKPHLWFPAEAEA